MQEERNQFGTGGNGGASVSGSELTPGSAETAAGVAARAQEYGQKFSDAAANAGQYLSETVSHLGEKIQEIRNKDISEVADEAKDYARKNPGQALLISAAAGFLLGFLFRRRR